MQLRPYLIDYVPADNRSSVYDRAIANQQGAQQVQQHEQTVEIWRCGVLPFCCVPVVFGCAQCRNQAILPGIGWCGVGKIRVGNLVESLVGLVAID